MFKSSKLCNSFSTSTNLHSLTQAEGKIAGSFVLSSSGGDAGFSKVVQHVLSKLSCVNKNLCVELCLWHAAKV